MIPTPTPVPAVAQNLKHYGDVCVNNNECESGTCDAGGGSRNIGAKKSCTAATVAENVTSIAMATGPFVVAFGGIAAAPVIAEALTGIAATNAAGGTGLATLPLATYSYATAAITASPALQTTIAVATLSQLPASIYACQIYGSDSPQCQYTAMGITSSYFSDVIGTEQALQGSAQVVKQNIVQPVVTAAKNYVNTITDPIGDTSNFRLTNAPSMQGQMLDNSLIEDFYGTAGTANSQGSQLAKYITGLDYTDPNLPDLLINDINIIRAKYNLPPRDMAFEDPYEYQRQLTALVQQKAGTTIIPEGDRLAFFESNPEAGGVFNSNDNAILTKYPRYDLYPENPQGALNTQGTVLTHEVVHALQNKYYSGMPIERMEYEAYLATISQNWLKKASPAEIVNMLFDYKINGSVSWWYKDQGLIPSWVNP